ncbi:MAG: hypothetical protein OXJ90_02975 [Spirochaetaceae bacterium]|nr:hypothetical protein [Spirochaetaceae bacterium]
MAAYRTVEYLNRALSGRGDAAAARVDAERIAAHLRERYRAEVIGIGSLFESDRPFLERSDIDLVVSGIPKGEYFAALSESAELTRFHLDLIPLEDANDLVLETARRGVRL